MNWSLPNLLCLCVASLFTLTACDDDGGATVSDTPSVDASGDSTPLNTEVTAADQGTETDGSVVPEGLASIDDLQYQGAFRISSGTFGASSTNYAVGTLAYYPANHSLFVAGHATEYAIAEFAIPTPGQQTVVADLPVVEAALQPFVDLRAASPNGNPEELDRVTGMLVVDGQLIVNLEQWYDASGDNQDTTLLVRDANALDAAVDGYFEMTGRAQAAGYMAPIPTEWQAALGGEVLTGWSSVYSIISRYSVGPSLWTFDPGDLSVAAPGAEGELATTALMSFPHGAGTMLGDEPLVAEQGAAPALWNFLSRGVYGFIIPGTRTFAVLGSTGGIESGIGYKITQDDGNLCGGYCSYTAADKTNYYWFFDLDEILAAENPFDPRPYAFGVWSVPFDEQGLHKVIGATFDPAGGILYVALENAGQVGNYDRPPLILTYRVAVQ